MLTDVHCHLDHERFSADQDKVIERARAAGFRAIITNGLNAETNRNVLSLAKKYDIVRPALGMYPVEALKLTDERIDAELQFIKEHSQEIAALGEIGIDYHWVTGELERKREKDILTKFLSLAEEIRKPVIIHSRGAEQEAADLIAEYDLPAVIMHCFGGSLALAKKCEAKGWLFSIPCSIVHNAHFQQLVQQCALTTLLTETDAPYQAPAKRLRNEPVFIAQTIKKIAELRGMSAEEVEAQIDSNFLQVFGE